MNEVFPAGVPLLFSGQVLIELFKSISVPGKWPRWRPFVHAKFIIVTSALADYELVEDRYAGSSSQRRWESRLLRNSGLSLGRVRIQTIFKVIA